MRVYEMTMEELLEHMDTVNRINSTDLEAAMKETSELHFTVSELMDISVAIKELIIAGTYAESLGNECLVELMTRIDEDIILTLNKHGIEI